MPKYLIYPLGYDPMVAAGPPTEDLISMNITWTEEETKQALVLESQAEMVTVSDRSSLPIGRWHREVKGT